MICLWTYPPWFVFIYLFGSLMSKRDNWLFIYGGRYVEPSIRPDDSRYGENPNRLQRHTQFQVKFWVWLWWKSTNMIYCWNSFKSFYVSVFQHAVIYFAVLTSNLCQVILKPDPGNSQDLFIRSLSALGSVVMSFFLVMVFSICR